MTLTKQQQQVFDAIKEFMDSDASVFILAGQHESLLQKLIALP